MIYYWILIITIISEIALNIWVIYNQNKLFKSQKDLDKRFDEYKENFKKTLPLN